jgi:hydrogenase maturation protease
VARALIIGYGNPLRSDDGFGWYAAHQLKSELHSFPIEIEVVTQQQLTPELAEVASHFQLLIFVDAARDLHPGQLRCQAITASQNGRPVMVSGFSHFATPAGVVALTAELYESFPAAYYISVGGECFDEGDAISPALRGAASRVLAMIRSLVAAEQ